MISKVTNFIKENIIVIRIELIDDSNLNNIEAKLVFDKEGDINEIR